MPRDPPRRLARRRPDAWPGWQPLIAAACIAAVLSVGWIGGMRARADDTIILIPNRELPRGVPPDVEQARVRSKELVRKYLHDPRARLDRAAFLLGA